MASQSAHFNLTKPATTDNYDIAVFNGNTDIIDTQMYNNQQNAAKVMVGATSQDDGESGRVPAPTSSDRTKFLKGDGTWDTPSGGVDMTGATASSAGTHGLVPAPSAGDNEKFLRGDGTWGTPQGGGGSDVSITPTLSSGTKIADYEINGVAGELYAPTSGSATKRYLGQLIERVSAADSHITSSGKTQYSGGENWKAFDGVESPSGISDCWAADENNTSAYIQYHFDSAYYFTQIMLKIYSHYSGAWTGDINILGSNDGVLWTNISSTGQAVSVTASLNAMNTETIDLDDTETWEYIRVQADGQAFNVPYQPCCDFGEIYVYGGEIIQGIDASTIDFSTLTSAQITQLQTLLGIGGE